MASYQITSWRDLPSLVVAREGSDTVKVPLDPRLQEAIDEAAMRLGEVGSDAYLAGWTRSPWTDGEGTPAELASMVVELLVNSYANGEVVRVDGGARLQPK